MLHPPPHHTIKSCRATGDGPGDRKWAIKRAMGDETGDGRCTWAMGDEAGDWTRRLT